MEKDRKIIIIGFGSIGRRHYQNLLKLRYKNVYAYDIDPKKIPPRARTISKLTAKELGPFRIVFICTPTHLHIKTALMAAEAKCYLFIEKPLSHNLRNIEKLIEVCQKNKLKTMIACNLRFNPCLRKIKELLDSGYLGRVYAIYLDYGRYLPYQRLEVDYREIYAANKKMGGGIILDDIHDFDLLFWFNNFKKVKRTNIIFDKLSNLKIDVEDIANITFLFENRVLGNIRCDYLQKRKQRSCRIIGENGNLAWDFRENAVYFEYFDKNRVGGAREQKKKIFQASLFDSNNMYIDEIKYFLRMVKSSQDTFNNLKKAQELLKVILKNKQEL